MNRQRLDARHLLCPMPVIRTQERVARLAPGEELEVLATDPGVLADIPAWCRVNGHLVLEAGPVDAAEREFRVCLRVGPNP
ncbi:MAG: sulfurtransferase TusA family protein [Gammaproteobacteria bacterium]|jgi:tRNA 2-thiouridine synthesizing protein A|nr:sulfurtransferase TusA family protein [Gammaproteobacteria bacterium]